MKSFSEKVYQLTKKIPKGRVTSYKEIANTLGTKAYRAVGQALRRNPYAPEVPCHRVVSSNGQIGGFNGKTKGKEIKRKIELLKSEGVSVTNNKVNLEKYLVSLKQYNG